jgi:hypothetical protein
MSADEIQVNASVSVPSLTVRLTSAYWQEKTGAIVTPVSSAPTNPAGIERAKTSGAAHRTASASSAR